MMRIFAFMIVVVSIHFGYSSEKFEKANNFYSEENFDSARVIYEELLEENEYSFEIFYNLGNSYFKENKLGLAILNWEKARKIKPSNPQVVENLNHAYTLTKDKFDVEISSVGFVRSFIYEKSPNFWSIISIITSVILAVMLFLFFTSKADSVHQISFYLSIISFIFLIGFLVFSSMHKSYINTSDMGVIIQPRAKILVAPSENSEESFPLHEGTKVEVVGEDGDWLEIIVNKDNRGWVKKELVGLI